MKHTNGPIIIEFLRKRAFLNIERFMRKHVFSNEIKAILSLPLAKLTSGWGQFKLS